MTEIETFPSLDRLGRPIPHHYDVYLDGKLLVTATDSPFEAARAKLAESGIYTNGVYLKPKVQKPSS